jgi:hypothetical protein
MSPYEIVISLFEICMDNLFTPMVAVRLISICTVIAPILCHQIHRRDLYPWADRRVPTVILDT